MKQLGPRFSASLVEFLNSIRALYFNLSPITLHFVRPSHLTLFENLSHWKLNADSSPCTSVLGIENHGDLKVSKELSSNLSLNFWPHILSISINNIKRIFCHSLLYITLSIPFFNAKELMIHEHGSCTIPFSTFFADKISAINERGNVREGIACVKAIN